MLYTAANAQLPAVVLLALIALLTAGLFLSTLKTNSWRPPVVASALWALVALVGGVIYPAVIQSLVVNPNQKDKERPYIAHNIEATRHALGIDEVSVVQNVAFDDITGAGVDRRHRPAAGRAAAEAGGDDRPVPHRPEPWRRADDQRSRS